MKRYLIIFSGYNQRAVIAFLRTLCKNNIDNYVIFASSEEDTILQTSYKSKVMVVRKKKELDWVVIKELLIQAKNEYGFEEFMIVPSTEALNRFCLKNRMQIEDLGGIDVLAPQTLYELLSDKQKFSGLCRKNGIGVPEEIDFPSVFGSGFVAKPKTYFSREGKVYTPVLISDKQIYENFCSSYDKNDFYYQEYVDGKSIYLLYYVTKEGDIYKFSQENFMQQPNGKSILVAKPAKYHMDSQYTKYEKLLLKIKYYGFIMIEVRVQGEKDYVIEANPRFWGPSQLFVDCGYNLFEIFLKEYDFLSGDITLDELDWNACYYWHAGVPASGEVQYYAGYEAIYEQERNILLDYEIYSREDTIMLEK